MDETLRLPTPELNKLRELRDMACKWVITHDFKQLMKLKACVIMLQGFNFKKVNTSDTEPLFLDLHLSIFDDFVSTKKYNTRDVFDFEIVNVPFLDGDVPRSTSSHW